ncbi:hypothetical protein DUI87_35389 [Hirundo rustica rustica]|uniref:Uncharacterized protein n=1 Tax=Hirundo rustica rustica TaxID=333673 RepID=A0A3M0IIU7_HIRRU|nr:hypothetical protein DUI87_35389 [Hirundo rustica rustica]
MVRLPRPRTRPRSRTRPRPWLHPLATLGLGSATAFVLGLLVAGIGRTPCRGGAVGAGPLTGGSTPDGVWGGASAEAPPPRPRLRELLQRHLADERVEAWVRGEVTLRWVGPGGEELERLPLDPEAFCAWSASGNATGYPELLHTKVAAYISLDRAVLGAERFVVRSSPTLVNLIESALQQVESPNEGGKNLLEQLSRPGRGWESDVIRPLSPDSGAFPFTAAAGVPALELGFDEAAGGGSGAVLGTPEDTLGRLGARLRGRLPAVARAVAAVAAHLLLRLGHDPRLPLDPGALGDALVRQLAPLQARGLSLQCLSSARGGVVRAAASLRRDMSGSDSSNERLNRGFNARLMAVFISGNPPQ